MVKDDMYLGNYSSNFDIEKGRTAMPKSFIKKLGDKAIITKGYEGSLMIVSVEDWQKVTEGIVNQSFLSGMARQTDRFLLGNAFEIDFDNQGRFIVPVKLREYAKLGKEITFVGVGNRIELWDQQAWDQNDQFVNENIAEISEKLETKHE